MISSVITWFLGLPWWQMLFLIVVTLLLGALLLAWVIDKIVHRIDPNAGRCDICGADLTVFKRGCKELDCPYFRKGDDS